MNDFIRRAFSENGEPSSSRILTALVVFFACGWVTSIVARTHALPDFAGLALFIGTLYGVNQAGKVIAGLKPPPPSPPA